jgi:DNA transformation protein
LRCAGKGVIFLKADDHTVPQFEREGLGPFSYRTKNGTRTLNSYWRMPERLYDDPDELADWARQAMEAARRTSAKPRPRDGKVAKKKKS